jgi:hypothetical protein
MTSPVPDADAAEQRLSADGSPAGAAVPPEVPAAGTSAAEADALEQALPVEHSAPARESVPLEATEADVVEQDAVVPLDDDERETGDPV